MLTAASAVLLMHPPNQGNFCIFFSQGGTREPALPTLYDLVAVREQTVVLLLRMRYQGGTCFGRILSRQTYDSEEPCSIFGKGMSRVLISLLVHLVPQSPRVL